jgi:hypothetical protein
VDGSGTRSVLVTDTLCNLTRRQLLGSDSNDIDIALEGVMGVPFAEHFVEFIASVKNLPIKSVSKVESNPDQSKHLETAKTTVLDTELDFVNLRSEEYAEGSRIPTEVVNTLPCMYVMSNDNTLLGRRLGHLCKMRCDETLPSTLCFTTSIPALLRTILKRSVCSSWCIDGQR